MKRKDVVSTRISRRHFVGLAGSVGISLLGGASVSYASAGHYDLAIVNGRLVDPKSGIDGLRNIGIKGGKVTAVTTDSISASRIIDARGLVVCPGFIDVHTHVDGNVRAAQYMASMGVTTVVGGNCGLNYVPEGLNVGAFFSRIDQTGFPINHALLTGAIAIRERIGITKDMAAEESSIKNMTRIARDSLERGAIGISFGLEYAPGTSRQEIHALCRTATEYGAIVTVHPRYSGRGLPAVQPGAVAAYEEMIEAAEKTGAKVQFSHMGSQLAWKSRPYDDLVRTCIDMVERARDASLDIAGDTYPYDAWCTFASASNLDPFLKGEPIRSIMRLHYFLEIGMLEVASGPLKGTGLTRELLAELRATAPETWIVGHTLQQDLVEEILKRPYVLVASDGVFDVKTGAPSHPRGTGTFPRFLRLVREKNLMGLTDAIARMTSLPASRFKLKGKGSLTVGADADITIFDPTTVSDGSTYLEPEIKPVGIEFVIVRGVPVVEKRELKKVTPGRAVRLPG